MTRLGGHLTTTSTPTPTASNAKSVSLPIIPPVPTPELLIAAIIRELPAGAVKTWEGVRLVISVDKPIYIFVVENAGISAMLQFKHPTLISINDKSMHYYITKETICQRIFFNRNFLPTFFVFDNYMHAYAFQLKLEKAQYQVQTRKFE